MKHIISLGAGVQSSTMALMAARAAAAARLLRNTQFIVIDRRTWERVA